MSDSGENGLPATPPPEQLTEDQRQVITKNRSHVFSPSATSINIPMLDGAKNWDH